MFFPNVRASDRFGDVGPELVFGSTGMASDSRKELIGGYAGSPGEIGSVGVAGRMLSGSFLRLKLETNQEQIFNYSQFGPFIRALQPICKTGPYIMMQLIVLHRIQINGRRHFLRWIIIPSVAHLLFTHTDRQMRRQRMMYD
jgi:hypothetical protein